MLFMNGFLLKKIRYKLTLVALVFGVPVSKGKVNRSLDLCLIAKETTGDCEHGFVFKYVYMVL